MRLGIISKLDEDTLMTLTMGYLIASDTLKWPFVLLTVVVLSLCYALVKAVYRLYFHPLAHLPGPKYCTISHIYEFYWDVIKHGQFYKKLKEIHLEYGPIVRVNPEEVHISDPDMYQELYWHKWGRYELEARSVGLPGSMVATADFNHHKARRGSVGGFFSKTSINNRSSIIEGKVEKLCSRLQQSAETRQIVECSAAYMALTADVITLFCFGESFGFLDLPEFAKNFKDNVRDTFEQSLFGRHFPSLIELLKPLPLWVMQIIFPPGAGMLEIRHRVTQKIKEDKKERESNPKNEAKDIAFHTVFDEIYKNQDTLLPSELEVERLTDEGQIFINAGSETTSRALYVGTVHLLLPANKDKLTILLSELKTVMPDVNSPILSFTQLESLPYLTAVVKECLRLNNGTTYRLARVCTEPFEYKGWTVPAGTPLSLSVENVLMDPSAFPDPETFRPERWLLTLDDKPIPHSNNVDLKNLKYNHSREKYLTAFSKGWQQCLGMYLAYAELYMCISAVFRRFEMELFETDASDVRVEYDFGTGFPRAVSVSCIFIISHLI